jgi:5-methyltetrahydropteroyltriglutamate--homocysteine methyltransferase
MSSQDRIVTTHVGSLPRPDALLELNRKRMDHESVDQAEFDEGLQAATAEVVRKQAEVGIDVRNDGEFGHAMAIGNDFASWWTYMFNRIGGFADAWHSDGFTVPGAPSSLNVSVAAMGERRDAQLFPAVYQEAVWADAGMKSSGGADGDMAVPVVAGPASYVGHEEVQRDITNLKTALAANGSDGGFMCSIGPGSLSITGNTYYKTQEEFVWACADVMAEEYQAIADAGLIVQIDEPSFADSWDAINPEPALEDFRAYTMVRVEALNHALRNIPREQVRFHCCWGSWHGPHVTDIELKDIVDMLMKIDAGTFLFEAANVRHEHEWSVWKDVKVPDGTKLAPGVVSHSTMLVEHPELVAQRLERFASVVGRENVIAGTDCGMGGRLHPDIAWAKLRSLSRGAELASKRLWP